MLIWTVDTDVVVLAVFSINQLSSGFELWLAFRTGLGVRSCKIPASCPGGVLNTCILSCLMLQIHDIVSCIYGSLCRQRQARELVLKTYIHLISIRNRQELLLYLASHQMAACLGPEMSCTLLMFHASTGCDTYMNFLI